MSKRRLLLNENQLDINGGISDIPNNTVFTHGTWNYTSGPPISTDLVNRNDTTDRLRLTSIGSTNFYNTSTPPNPTLGGFFRRDGAIYKGEIQFRFNSSSTVVIDPGDVYTIRIGTYNKTTSAFVSSVLIDFKDQLTTFIASNPTSRLLRVKVSFITGGASTYSNTNFIFRFEFFGALTNGTLLVSEFYTCAQSINLSPPSGTTPDYNPSICLDTEVVATKYNFVFIEGAYGEFTKYIPF